MKAKHQMLLLLILIILPPLFIVLSHRFFDANYISSSIYKIIFLSPIAFRLIVEKKQLKQSFTQYFSTETFKKNFLQTMGIGTLLASIYLVSFYLFKDYLNLQNTINQLSKMASINATNIIAIGLYIIVINSLLEEFFWRGFLFDKLNILIKPWMAYLLTGFAFSFHHIVFYYNWFSLPFFITITIGLTGYAIIMNWVFQRKKDLFTCWLIHAFADMAQIFIALKIFEII